MAVQIDSMHTTVELTSAAAAPSPGRTERSSASGTALAPSSELSGLVGRLLADELDRFLRNRGMSG